jgi:hypothetical protein
MMARAAITSVGAMIETYRMLGREREAELIREAERLHRRGRRRRTRLRLALPLAGGAARKRAVVLARGLVRARG